MKHRLLTSSFVLLALACLHGCEGGQAKLVADTTPGLLFLSTGAIDFGMADCGGDPPENQSITLTNQGNVPLRWAASLDSGAFFSLAGEQSGTIEPGGQVSVLIAAGEMPADVAAGSTVKATLLLTTNDALQDRVFIPIEATAHGATMEVIAQKLADFGQAPAGTSAPDIAVLMRNTGNATVSVAVEPPPDPQFSFTWAGGNTPVEVGPGEAMPALTAHFVPASNVDSSSAAVISVDGPVCGDSVDTLDVRGQGLAGSVGVSPGIADFGKVDCNSQAEPMKLTVFNTGNFIYAFSAALTDGSRYNLSPKAGAVPAGGSMQLTLTPKPIGMTTDVADNAFGDTLTITSDVPGAAPHEIPVKQTAFGAILSWSSIDAMLFGVQPLFTSSASQARGITNAGNSPAVISLDHGPFETTPAVVTIPAGASQSTSIVYKPDNFGRQVHRLGIVTQSPICQPLPPGPNATGEGSIAKATAISMGGDAQRNRGNGSHGGCAILEGSNGRIACWGTNEFGQLGELPGESIFAGINVVPGIAGVTQVASAGDYNCAIAGAVGEVYCWGNNRGHRNNQQINGKLGLLGVGETNVPTKLEGIDGAVQLSIGHNRGCAVTDVGGVFCWGRNNFANRSGGNANHTPPFDTGQTDAKSVAVSGRAVCVHRNDGTVFCWGRRCDTGLGRGNNQRSLPGGVITPGISDVLQLVTIGGGGGRTGGRCVLHEGGSISCWGHGRHGRLGNGTDTGRRPVGPVQVSGISDAIGVAGGYFGACALMSDQTARCWGRNEYGQVGDGTTNTRYTPVQVTGLEGATTIAMGGAGACAIVAGGSIKCWGNYGVGTSTTPTTLVGF